MIQREQNQITHPIVKLNFDDSKLNSGFASYGFNNKVEVIS